jgi:hypothetical protein
VPGAHLAAPWIPIARATAASVGRVVGARNAALVTALLLPAAIVFGGAGTRPSDVARWFADSIVFRALSLGIWTLVAATVVAPALTARGTSTLRSMPVATWRFSTLLVILTAAVQLPPVCLLAADGSVARAVTFCAAAGALELLIAARTVGAAEIASGALSASLVVAPVPPLAAAPVSLVVLFVVARSAWIEAPSRGSSSGGVRVVGGPGWLALALVHALRLARVETPALLRGVLLSVGAGLAAAIASRNGEAHSLVMPDDMVLYVTALPLVAALAFACAPILANEWRILWALESAAMTVPARRGAAVLVVGGLGVSFGAIAGACASMWRALCAPVLVGECAVWGGSMGLALLAWGRVALRDDAKDTSRFALGALAMFPAALLFVRALGPTVAPFTPGMLGLAVAFMVPTPRHAEEAR